MWNYAFWKMLKTFNNFFFLILLKLSVIWRQQWLPWQIFLVSFTFTAAVCLGLIARCLSFDERVARCLSFDERVARCLSFDERVARCDCGLRCELQVEWWMEVYWFGSVISAFPFTKSSWTIDYLFLPSVWCIHFPFFSFHFGLSKSLAL